MLEEALVPWQASKSSSHDFPVHSSDWDEVQEFCKNVYMPYRVRPLERFSKPDSTMVSARTGRITLTRFCYGAGIHLDQFDPAAGKILVLNTLAGSLNHKCDQAPATTSRGESFVVDCSRTDYWLEGDANHMQLNLTIPHEVMELVCEKWFGFIPDDRLWTRRAKFGGPGSHWLSLLDYVSRSISLENNDPGESPLGRHLEEILCLELLKQWADCAGLSLRDGGRCAAPHYVRRAEEIFEAEAREAPTVGDVSRRVGVSARTLTEGFRRFRGISPRAFLIARRLEGFRNDLLTTSETKSVSDIAGDWGYVNLGALAGAYRERYGELPSQTRRAAKKSV